MRGSTRPWRTLALCGALIGAVLSAAPVGAQPPIVATTPPVVIVGNAGIAALLPPVIVIPPIIPGGNLHDGPLLRSGRADVDFDRNRSRERGQVVAH